MKLVAEALSGGDPNAIPVAAMLIRKQSHPLVSEAVRASVRYLADEGATNPVFLPDAVRLIVRFGSDRDFAFFIGQLRNAKAGDMKRYAGLWSACDEDYRQLPKVCREVIDDKRAIFKDDRFCDRAVWALERTTKMKFGAKYGRNSEGGLEQSESDRDKSVEKAKAWLKTNYPGSSQLIFLCISLRAGRDLT